MYTFYRVTQQSEKAGTSGTVQENCYEGVTKGPEGFRTLS